MGERVCPMWVGYLLVNPIRTQFQNPKTILGPYVSEGMKVLDIGSAMGFFSIPLARMVGPSGRVICVDVQSGMIAALEKRARKAGVADSIETRVCASDSLGVKDLIEQIDFALAFAVVHEVPDVYGFFGEVIKVLKKGRLLLVAEPIGRVSQKNFDQSVITAKQCGFTVTGNPRIRGTHTALLRKQG